MKLTPLQQEYVDFMSGYFLENDQFPPMLVLADYFDVYPNAVQCNLECLMKKGVVTKNKAGKWKRGPNFPPICST